eukprot:TRINITY_DN122768_c0_g1_i1.p1 TRINITY_DN122768_c0_g1~~TRINITY_DN122768_c0_g1_i1.p1  ORF type:complete len:736 (+),score=165.31 TRINITY_DN122768_c0_g1_i1:82-2289(+)
MGCLRLCVLAVVLASTLADDIEEAALPRIRWGQTKEKLFVTLVVKNLNKDSVKFSFSEDRFRAELSDEVGRLFRVDMELAQDIEAGDCHWEHSKRADRWGDAVLATMLKKFPDRWDTLPADMTLFKGVVEKDWTRESQALEPNEEDAFLAEHRKDLPLVTAAGLEKARGEGELLVLLLRHPSCEQCKVADDNFANVAQKVMKKGSKTKSSWQARVRFGLVNARKERSVVRLLGGRCAAMPQDCRYHIFSSGMEEPLRIRARHSPEAVIKDLESMARPQFQSWAAAKERRDREGDVRGVAVLAPGAPQEVRNAANRVRLRLDIAVAEAGAEAAALGIADDSSGTPTLLAWPPGEKEPQPLRLNSDRSQTADDVERWLRVRAVAPIARTHAFEEDEPYEELQLPVARLWAQDSALCISEARAAIRTVALQFLGRVAFIERNGSSKAHEWRHHGLPDAETPAFALASSMKYNATRYAFLDPRSGDCSFWRDDAAAALSAFLESALSGSLAPSLMSEAPPAANFTGVEPLYMPPVKKLVGRTCRQVLEDSDKDVLLEGYDEWRRDHARRTVQFNTLAPLLDELNISVYRLDFGNNECPQDFLQTIPAGYSGYFFAARQMKARNLKLQKLKKLDPPFDRVLQFLKKHSDTAAAMDVNATLARIDAAVAQHERWETVQQLSADRRLHWASTLVVGAVGILLFLKVQKLGPFKVPPQLGPEPPPVPARRKASDSAEVHSKDE